MNTGGKTWKMGKTACLALALAVSVSAAAFAAEPWSKVGEDFVYSDGTAIKGALEKGVSVSKYQNFAGKIDWEQVSADDVTFAMIRLGSKKERDPYFEQNVKEAAEAGIKPGVFFFTEALTQEEAKAEAEFVLDMIKDYPIAFPIAYDVDSEALLKAGLTKQEITAQVNTFCQVISEAGYLPVVYGEYEYLTKHLDMGQIVYDVWYVRYGVASPFHNRTLWRCTDAGKVAGISGDVCIEFAFADYGKEIPGDTWRTINGKRYYYKDHKKQTGWIVIDGQRYYLDKDGVMVYDTIMNIDGALYKFDANGHVSRKSGR